MNKSSFLSSFFNTFLIKKQRKNEEQCACHKNRPKDGHRDDFLRQELIFKRFGGPWGSLWGGLEKDFGEKLFGQKKKQKKRGEAGCLGGRRGPQQGGILGRITGGRDPTRLRPTGGRADCLRFASPAEATGGLEGWRLGGYIKKTIKNHKMDTEAAQMMPKSSQN